MESLLNLELANKPPTGQPFVPTGPRVPYAETVVPFWQSTAFLIVMAVIVICIVVALTIFLYRKLSRNHYYRSIDRRMQEERAYMRSSLFDAASDITRVSAMYNMRDRRRR